MKWALEKLILCLQPLDLFFFIVIFIHLIATSSGASKLAYAPEPLDVGRVLQADILSNGQKITVTSAGPIESGWFWSLMFDMISLEVVIDSCPMI